MHTTIRMLTTAVVVILLALTAPQVALAQSGSEFPGLEAGQRVVDRTGDSLTADQVADLQDRMQALEAAGADAVAYVRALDASPEDTLAQVEALQQAWVARTGADQDTAAAILINRNPDDPEDARAGIFVGRTFQEGNVPEDEQIDIVEEVLIPPLRDGDVHASLADTIDRLTTSVREGPPVSAFDVWAEGAASTWVPWVALGIAVALLLLAVSLFGRRQTTSVAEAVPTTTRPGDLPPAVAAALAGRAAGSAVQATLLDLATRGAIALEPEGGAGTPSDPDDPAVQVRLVDRTVVRDPVEEALWEGLAGRAEGDVVDGEGLQGLADDPPPVGEAIEERLLAEGWRDPSAGGPRAGLIAIGVVGVVLALAVLIVIAGSGLVWPSILGVIALVLLLPICGVMVARYSRLSVAGQHAAVPWQGYREGLEAASHDNPGGVDLDAVLPDLVAFGLVGDLDVQLEAAAEAGRPLRAFGGGSYDAGMSPAMYVVLWSGLQSSTTPTASASGGTVSGVGAGGGGGAAGST